LPLNRDRDEASVNENLQDKVECFILRWSAASM
jgi:hypothetical protein